MTGQGQNFLFDKLVLSDDATLGGDRSWGSVRSQSTLDMGGHGLTIAASAYWRFTDVEHPGDIVLRSWLDVRDNGTFPASEDVHEIRVMATGVLSFYGWPKPCPWRIRFAEPTSGTFNVHPGGGTSESLNVLSGPVVIDEGVTVRFNYQNDARWQMTFAGPVSGAGSIELKMPGTLRFLSGDNAFTGTLPAGTALVLQSGATLDLNGLAASFAGLDGTGGKVVGGDLALLGTLALSAQKFLDRETTAIDGTLDLTGVTRLELTEADALTEEALRLRPLSLVSATAIRYPSPSFEIVGVPKGWCLVCTPTALRLKRARGLAIVIR